MPSFREQFQHFNGALLRPRHRVLPEERVAAWRVYIAGCYAACKNIRSLSGSETVKLNDRFRMARASVDDAVGADLSPVEELAIDLELKLLRFRIWRLSQPGIVRYPKTGGSRG